MVPGMRIDSSLEIFSAIDDKRPLSANMHAGLSRLSTTYLVLALAKWMEFYKRYRELIPQRTAVTAKTVYRDLEKRNVRDFRNKVVGHIWGLGRVSSLLLGVSR